jgi:hypothetical protein
MKTLCYLSICIFLLKATDGLASSNSMQCEFRGRHYDATPLNTESTSLNVTAVVEGITYKISATSYKGRISYMELDDSVTRVFSQSPVDFGPSRSVLAITPAGSKIGQSIICMAD